MEEARRPGELPKHYVLRLAEAKARAVRADRNEVILAADTVVVVGAGEAAHIILEKPRDEQDACRMLRLLSGRKHEVITGICLLSNGKAILDTETTTVHFLPLSDADIQGYVNTGEPADKAGGYAIQGRACRFIQRLEGCYFNVVGLPVSLVWQRLQQLKQGG